MKQTPVATPGQTTPVKPVDGSSQSISEARGQFFSAAISMSWQLAVVVLVPILVGFQLDNKLNMLPLLTIVGFLIAMVGMAYVVWRQMQLYSPPAAEVKHP